MVNSERNFIITTSLGARSNQHELAARISVETGIPYIARDTKTIGELKENWQPDGIVVVEPLRIVCIIGESEFFFHPAMAVIRIKEIKSGKNDQMIKAMDLCQGQCLLDCTLGLATDAIVASYIVGPEGFVLGIENSPLVASIVRVGLQKRYKKTGHAVLRAMNRITVLRGDHRVILQDLPDNSFEVVYFDPMFRVPRSKSSGINALRPLADHRPITQEVLAAALRIAKKRVVVKENRWGYELKKLGFDLIQGGANSSVRYGIKIKDG
ncbi:Putative SAM-dependent methyltransferase [Desulfotomaculum arcticum]|uniref:Putative SAM-dependent methyltransferase n=1 Tax=Desulfotruncus arcticus DSM 17038 TaxID=1121424 RepID=A0A1I2S0R7_9FIRM|nr:class I SAM-dependent methyltransferase [Desulfotruncus arcticus]SFG46525.1 Putative SAM-dependent methyltransferase [Desulfotomaculum arcticum] [Desulfotruncus arcticus DSM 17038]